MKYVKGALAFIGYSLQAILLVLIGQMVGGVIGAFADMLIPQSDLTTTASMYFNFIWIWVVVIIWLAISKKNRYILSKVTTKSKGNNVKNWILGLVIGFVTNGTCILVAWLHKDIAVSYRRFEIIPFLILFISVFIQSSAEELVCRGVLYQKLLHRFKHPAVAIFGNSLLFASLHLLNPGVNVLSIINIMASGVLMSLAVYCLDSLWCAFTIHAAWNFTQSILFGLPNSGLVVPYSIFGLDAGSAVNSFAYDVAFGVEGTIVADIVLIMSCIIFFVVCHNKKKEK